MQGTHILVIGYQEVVSMFWGLLGLGFFFLLLVMFGSNNIQTTSGTVLI